MVQGGDDRVPCKDVGLPGPLLSGCRPSVNKHKIIVKDQHVDVA